MISFERLNLERAATASAPSGPSAGELAASLETRWGRPAGHLSRPHH